MTETAFPWHRFAAITELAAQAPSGRLGRTALMKLTYFLQALRGVPLGYDFRLYAYGPFDADVLDDLDYVQTLGAVTVTTVYRGQGYGYDIQQGTEADKVKARAAPFLAEHRGDLDWVIREFGHYSAADLELVSTMIYVDREALRAREKLSLMELVERVLAVKPRFARDYALTHAEALRADGLLGSVQQ